MPASSRRRSQGTAVSARAASNESDAADIDALPQNGEEVYRRLREMIILGKLAAGTPITERRVAERLSVSRTPVRGALHRLEQEGFVESVGSDVDRRLIVAPLTKDDGGELWLMVAHLEGMAARRAADLPASRRKTLAQRMRTVYKDLSVALKGGVYATEPYNLDLEFHRLIVEEASGPRFVRVHRSMKLQVERYARAYFGTLITGLSNSVAEHDKLVKAVAAGEPAAAQHAVEVNWYNAAARLLRTIDEHGERGTW